MLITRSIPDRCDSYGHKKIMLENIFCCLLGLTQVEELYSFAVVFFASFAGKKDHSKDIFRSAEGEKRCLRKSYL